MSDLTTTAPTQRAAAEDVCDQFVGLMRIGNALLALPVSAIREVIPGQGSYGALPVKAEGMLGVVDIRGTIVPVLDLRHHLGVRADDDSPHVIVIMRWQGLLLGLRANEVCGIARPKETELFALATTRQKVGTLATHTFQTGGKIATLLSAQAIAELPDVPLVSEKLVGRASGQAMTTESILLFSYGLSHFGIDATCVDATVPAMRIERNALASGFCLGVIDHHGFEVPVVDTAAAIGLGRGTPLPQTPIIVVRYADEAMLGFAIDAVLDIVRVQVADILAMPALAIREASLFRGMFSGAEGRQNLLIDANHLRANPALSALARLRKPRLSLQSGETARVAERGATAAPAQSFLTYVAGAEHATSLDQVMEILTYPTDVAPFEMHGIGVLGLFTHRGQVAPLVSLGSLLGRPFALDPATARILFVEDAGRRVGFVVEALRSIEKASWYSPAAEDADSHRSGLFNSLVMLGAGEDRRMVSHIDLIAQIGRLYQAAASHEPCIDDPERKVA